MTKLFYCFISLLMVNAAVAQSSRPVYRSMAGFQYLEAVKGKVTDNEAYPLLIAFHYSSGKPEETIADYDSLKTPVRIIIPRGNHPKREGFSYFPVNYYKEDSITQIKLSRTTLDSVAAFVKAIEASYDTRAVVSGISQGGDLAWLLAVYHPELCKAAFPFAAFIHRQSFDDILKLPVTKVPVYLYQGEADPIIAIDYTRAAVKKLGTKLNLKLTTYPGVKHEISLSMKKDYSLLIDKMLKQ
jgi:phospholipase/carboxylesterase